MATPSHEDMIKEFAKLAGSLSNTPKQNKAMAIAKKAGFFAGKNLVALAAVVLLATLGWVGVGAAHEIGLITWHATWWQAIRLFVPLILFIVCVPLSISVKLKS